MNRAVLVLLSAGIVSASYPLAIAEDPEKIPQLPPRLVELLKGRSESFIGRLDKNHDGFLSKEELPPRLAKALDKFDTNGDKKLDPKEVEQMLQTLRRRFGLTETGKSASPNPQAVERMVRLWLQRLDKDKDGKLSKEEARNRLAKAFGRLDANKNGFLEQVELRDAAKRFLAARGKSPNGPQGGNGPEAPDFDALDRNADGRLTSSELQGTPFAAQFSEMDANKDGKIHPKEFAAYLTKKASKEK